MGQCFAIFTLFYLFAMRLVMDWMDWVFALLVLALNLVLSHFNLMALEQLKPTMQ
jgi:hypothetical protein